MLLICNNNKKRNCCKKCKWTPVNNVSQANVQKYYEECKRIFYDYCIASLSLTHKSQHKENMPTLVIPINIT